MFWRERHAPFAKGVPAQILAQLGGLPVLAAVGRKRNLGHAVPAIKSNPAHDGLASALDTHAIGQAGYERAYVHAVDRYGLDGRFFRLDASARIVWNAISLAHPESIEYLAGYRNVGQVFHPISAVVAGDDQPHWVAVQQGQVGAVHLPRQHHFTVERVIDI